MNVTEVIWRVLILLVGKNGNTMNLPKDNPSYAKLTANKRMVLALVGQFQCGNRTVFFVGHTKWIEG